MITNRIKVQRYDTLDEFLDKFGEKMSETLHCRAEAITKEWRGEDDDLLFDEVQWIPNALQLAIDVLKEDDVTSYQYITSIDWWSLTETYGPFYVIKLLEDE